MLAAVLGLLVTLLAPWEAYWIPAGSMKPGLLPGDYLLALPVGGPPRRGQVVIFSHPVTGTAFVKRVIALPGDTVALSGGQVVLNGASLPLVPAGTFVEARVRQGAAGVIPVCANGPVALGGRCEKFLLRESLPGGGSHLVLDTGPTALDDSPDFAVPEGFVFVLGDNRDNSNDSRTAAATGGLGPVPLASLRARPVLILFSSTGRWLWNPAGWRPGRMLVPVR